MKIYITSIFEQSPAICNCSFALDILPWDENLHFFFFIVWDNLQQSKFLNLNRKD